MAQTSPAATDTGRRAHSHRTLKLHLWAPSFNQFGGGIAAYSRELALGLAALGHDATLFGKVDLPGYFGNFPVRGAGNYGSRVQTYGFTARCLAGAARERPGHVIATHVNFSPLAYLVKGVLRIPFSLVAHGIDVHDKLDRGTLAGMRAADRIFAVSEWTRGKILRLDGMHARRIALLPNTFDESRFNVRETFPRLRTHYKIQPDERVMITVARLSQREGYKGYDRMIQAIPAIQRAVGRVRFIIVGDGDERSRLEKLSEELAVGSAVTFAGFVPDEELADHYRMADVFAMPSTGEGFGIVFLEAMACGTPVLAGNRDGSVDALDRGVLGKLVDPMNVDAIAAGIVSLLRREGPSMWYEPRALSAAVTARFGRDAFRSRLREVLPF